MIEVCGSTKVVSVPEDVFVHIHIKLLLLRYARHIVLKLRRELKGRDPIRGSSKMNTTSARRILPGGGKISCIPNSCSQPQIKRTNRRWLHGSASDCRQRCNNGRHRRGRWIRQGLTNDGLRKPPPLGRANLIQVGGTAGTAIRQRGPHERRPQESTSQVRLLASDPPPLGQGGRREQLTRCSGMAWQMLLRITSHGALNSNTSNNSIGWPQGVRSLTCNTNIAFGTPSSRYMPTNL